ncbi:hypothetical protein HBE96_00240 [Clostridium sp. P21]|uniref:Uncharacterized protein n=1 Tax=Clostridium muellerianum TaxID=2716538 RepID=A0A7Y0HLE6_9CLOT|nr:hypothetical protein [Clostridium muellerianum]NMM61155.1 hypothetical protein [Clostridium muellerianum]
MLNLQKEVYKKMNELCDNPAQVIYEKHKTTDESLEMYIVIVKILSADIPRFRIYKGLQYNKSTSVECFTINEDMYLAITSNLVIGEV